MLASQTTAKTMKKETMNKFKMAFEAICKDSNIQSAIESEYNKIESDI